MRKFVTAGAAAALVMGIAGAAAAQCSWGSESMAEKATPVPAGPVESADAGQTPVPAILLPTEAEADERDEG